MSINFHIIGNMKSMEAIAILSALASEARLAVYRMLVKRGPEGYTPSELIDRLDLPAPTLSFHLNVLAAAELIQPHKNGRSISYSAVLENVNQLTSFLMENCCGGRGGCGPLR